MTSIDLPIFVKDLFANEINKIKVNLIKQIAKDYYLDEDELIKQYTCDIEIINSKMENIQITKKNKYNNNISKQDRCLARVASGKQCKRSKNIGDLCTLHFNKLDDDDNLKYGYINEPAPAHLFPKIDQKREKIY